MSMLGQTQQKGIRQRTRGAWLNDYKIFGGSESTQKRLLDIAPDKIDFLTPTTFWTGYDLYILNNFRGFAREQLEYVLTRQFVMYWHDILYEDAELIQALCRGAKANIFLSPLHFQQFQQKFGIIVGRAFVIPPLFDDKLPTNEETRGGICWYGSIWPHKGIENCLLYARKNKIVIDFYGNGHPLIIEQLKASKYANYKGLASKDILAKYKYFIHMPEEIEAFGRAAFEAYLAGCYILHNNKVGAFSFGWNYEDKQETLENCLNGMVEGFERKQFWEIVNDSKRLPTTRTQPKISTARVGAI